MVLGQVAPEIKCVYSHPIFILFIKFSKVACLDEPLRCKIAVIRIRSGINLSLDVPQKKFRMVDWPRRTHSLKEYSSTSSFKIHDFSLTNYLIVEMVYWHKKWSITRLIGKASIFPDLTFLKICQSKISPLVFLWVKFQNTQN